MKRFYLHNENEQQGPFDIEELRTKKVSRETPVWHEGLKEWTKAEDVEELREFFNSAPPPFETIKLPNPSAKKLQSQVTSKQTTKKKNLLGSVLQSIGIILAIIFIVMIIQSNLNDENKVSVDIMSVEEIERTQPTSFLTASGNYTENFWGTKIKVNGIITNTATVTTYKDAVVKINYYSKTKTVIGNKSYTIYEVFPPNSTTQFELKIDNYNNVNSIGWEVESATAN